MTRSAGCAGSISVGRRSGASPVNEETGTKKKRTRRVKRKEKKISSVEAGKEMKEFINAGLVFTYTTYGKNDLRKIHQDLEYEMLEEFLTDNAVSGGSRTFTLKDLTLIDEGGILCCWSSTPGERGRQVFGMRVVAYFWTMKAIVLNLTVIFKHARSQKNLDPMNKVSI